MGKNRAEAARSRDLGRAQAREDRRAGGWAQGPTVVDNSGPARDRQEHNAGYREEAENGGPDVPAWF